jgi:hypothetical protein
VEPLKTQPGFLEVPFIYILILSILFIPACKPNKNVNTNELQAIAENNIIERNLQTTTNSEVEKPISLKKDGFPIYIEGSPPFLQFSDSGRVNVWADCIYVRLDNIRVYETTNKESESVIIYNNPYSLLFRLPETEDWLYYLDHGFIYIYDFTSNSNYDSSSKKHEQESELLQRFSIFRRYGPLLEIHYNNKVIKFWDHFGGETGSSRIILEDYYEGYDEILIGIYFYEGGGNRIYNLRLENYTGYGAAIPYFNNSRNTVFSVRQSAQFYNPPLLIIYTISNGIYTKVVYETLGETFNNDYEDNYIKEMYWINDNEFKIEAEKGNLLVRRNGMRFDLVYN